MLKKTYKDFVCRSSPSTTVLSHTQTHTPHAHSGTGSSHYDPLSHLSVGLLRQSVFPLLHGGAAYTPWPHRHFAFLKTMQTSLAGSVWSCSTELLRSLTFHV